MPYRPEPPVSILKCPLCGTTALVQIPMYPKRSWECVGCRQLISVQDEQCCIFCEYGSNPCTRGRMVRMIEQYASGAPLAMRTPLSTAQESLILLFDPDMARAGELAARLYEYHVCVVVALSAEDALHCAQQTHFDVVVVSGDAGNNDCLRFLASLRRTSPHTWLIAADARIDQTTEVILHRQGVDAVVGTPIDVSELARRIALLQVQSRPSF